ncbi:hypothetical protein BKA62DRAFT_31853 [Auriculariales sp. MPI-PUGE-AT-0066]|nr:hypothetical protein BKA62DRAFT_31853 [Auriculariales sp. MPI-PUGE-AT-0066]
MFTLVRATQALALGRLKGQFPTRRHASTAGSWPSDFVLHPQFLNQEEQRVLLRACLEKLDATESREARKRRRLHMATGDLTTTKDQSVGALFLPDTFYEFQEGHMDGVIRLYREMHVSGWPTASQELQNILQRIHGLLPSGEDPQLHQTHILHLSSEGFIAPHVDNVESSGSWILGISLGDSRNLLLESTTQPHERLEISLPSGSLYIQKDTVRYKYLHSILPGSAQRLSFMIRDYYKG